MTLLIVASAALNGPQERYRYPVDPAIAVLMASGVVARCAHGACGLLQTWRGSAAPTLTPALSQRERETAGQLAPPLPRAGEGVAGG